MTGDRMDTCGGLVDTCEGCADCLGVAFQKEAVRDVRYHREKALEFGLMGMAAGGFIGNGSDKRIAFDYHEERAARYARMAAHHAHLGWPGLRGSRRSSCGPGCFDGCVECS